MATVFDTMRELINEVDKVCDIVKEENKKLENSIQEQAEEAYFMMCTDLAPYYELYKEMYEKDEGISFYIDISHKYAEENTCIAFYIKSIYVCSKHPSGLSMHTITCKGDFCSYDALGEYYKENLIIPVAKGWFLNGYARELEKSFTDEVQKYLTKKAEKLEKENKELKQKLNIV